MTEQSKFPVILIPGIFGYGEENQLVNKVFPYFGMTSASAARVIAEVGNPVHTASFRPLSGVWERACELYAQIKGGKVDYGKAYAEKHHISQYGEIYPGWVPNWGEEGVKVTLVGHGFGATVARLLTALMARGSRREREAGGSALSPLFAGGHYTAVHAVVTLAGLNDGTTLFQTIDSFAPNLLPSCVRTILKREQKAGHRPADETAESYLAQTDGNLFYEAGLDGMSAYNAAAEDNGETYYFAFTGEVTEDVTQKVKEKIPDKLAFFLDIDKGTFWTPFAPKRKPFVTIPDLFVPGKEAGALAPTAALLAFFQNHLPEQPIVDAAAKPNDGLVNTNTSLAPSTEPAAAFQDVYSSAPGKWYQMPIERRNHLSFTGLFVRPDVYRNEILNLIHVINGLTV